MAFWFSKKDKNARELDEIRKKERRPVSALALSGGGSRGYAHVGVLKAFEEEGIDFDIVVGTSVGSLTGALYACGIPTDEIIARGRELKIEDIRDKSFILTPSNPANIERVMRDVIGNAMFSDLKKPFAAVAVDLKTGKEIVLNMGSVARAVSASCCVPLVFRPVIWNDWHLVDGGLKNVLPADVARAMGADKVVGVDINSARGSGTDSLRMLDVVRATARIMMAANAKLGIRESDIVLLPDTRKFKSTKKDGYEEMMEEGYRVAKEAAPRIRALLSGEDESPLPPPAAAQ